MRKHVFRRIRWQYFFSFLLVMLVVMAILLGFTFQSFDAFLTEIQLGHYGNSLSLVSNAMDDAITDTLFVAEQLSATNNITPFHFWEHPERALQTSAALRVYSSTFDAIDNLVLYFMGDEKIYETGGSYLLDRFFRKGVVVDGYTAEQMTKMINDTQKLAVLPEQHATGYVFNSNNIVRDFVPIVVPYAYTTGIRCGTLMSMVDRSTFAGWVRQFALEDTNLYMTFNGSPVLSFASDGTDFAALKAAVQGIWPASGGKVRVGEQTYFLLRKEESGYGVAFYLMVPDSRMRVVMSGRMSMLMVATLLAAAVGLTLIMAMVQSRVKPIMLLREMLVDDSDASSKPSVNELTQIRDGIQRLMSENQVMTEKIGSMDVLQKSDFAHRFITGAFSGQDEYLSLAEECRLNVDTRCFVIGLLVKPSDSTYELSAEKMNQFFGDEVGGVSRMLDGNGRLAFVAFADNGDALMAFLEQRFNSMKVLCAGATMAVSAIHGDYIEGPRAFLEADMAFEMRFLRGNTRMIRFETQQPEENDVARNQQAVERLRSALRMGDAERVSDALNGISTAMHAMHSTLFDFRCMYNDILGVISTEARKTKGATGEFYDLFRLSQCLSLDDLDMLLRNACARVMVNRVQAPRDDVPAPVSHARELIASRFAEPELSVADIAQEVGFTDSKLSVEFKKAYHMTPLEFMTRKRMLLAKDLLLSSEMPIKDIAIECGYYDISAFNRRFKAYSGMTPQQYRLSSASAEEEARS